MPLYQLSVCYPADAVEPAPEALAAIMRDVEAVRDELVEAGAWVFGGGLAGPSSATVVQADRDSDPVLTDGPFIESKEQIGGITVIEVADLDAALAWATKQAVALTLPVEVRPFLHGGSA
jgi:hypothetical protein